MYKENISTEEVKDINPQSSQVVNDKPKKKFHFNWKKFIGYFFLGILVLGIGYLGYRFYEFKPYRVIVSNVTSRSATISWVTETPESGEVIFKKGSFFSPFLISTIGSNVGYDDRDYSNAELEVANTTFENMAGSGNSNSGDIETEVVVTKLGKYWSHHVTIRNLNPETEYEFMVGDGLIFEKANIVDTENNIIKTKIEDDEIRTPVPAYGIVRYYDREKYNPPVDTLIYCTLYEETSQIKSDIISSVISETGGWYLDLTNAYTSSGGKFLTYTEKSDEANIKLRLTIENEWLGRWSKEIDISESAPAKAIELYDIEDEEYTNPDEDLEYDGLSFNEDEIVSILINDVFAKTSIDVPEFPITTAKEKKETSSISNDISKAKVTKNKEIQVSLADAARAAAYEAQAADYFKKESVNTENTDQERIEAAKKAQQAEERSKKVIETIENSKDNKIEVDTMTDIVKEIKKTELTDEEVLKSMRGSCSSDSICKPDEEETLQCGWYSEEKCTCACGGDSVDISAGDYCSCDFSNGQPIVKDGGIGKVEEYGDYLEGGYHCVLGEAQGYWVREGYDVGIDMPVLSDITNKEDCFATNRAEYTYIGYEEKLETEEITSIEKTSHNDSIDIYVAELLDSIRCEDSVSHNLVVVGYSTEKYLDCNQFNNYSEKIYKESSCVANTASLGGYCCNELNHSYSKIDGIYAQCLQNQWVEVKEEDIKKKLTVKYTTIGLGESCRTDIYDYCQCKYSITDKDGTASGNYKITKGSLSAVCGVEFNSIEAKELTILKPSPVSAENDLSSTYLIDVENSMIKGLTPGEYSYKYNGDLYMFDITEYEYAQTGGEFSLYVDLDRDGEIDNTDVKVTESATEIELSVLEKGFTYSLREGFNFVSFPFIFTNEDIKTASNLLTYLNDKYDNSFYSISKYDSGKWVIVGSNGGTYDQNDFQLIPGQGYVLKTKWDLNITLYGNEVTYESDTDSAPIRFMPGWNLVGLYGTGVKSYTAESILTDITNYEDINFTAVNVSRWVESRALYEALQRDTDSTVYGLDFPIELKKSYFIKVTDGEGNWEPGIKNSTSSSSMTVSKITTAELNQGWYWGDKNQKKSGTPDDWILVNSGTRNAKWTEPTMSLLEIKCMELGGEWVEKFKDCDNITKTLCEDNDETYIEFPSACRDSTDESLICAQTVTKTCSFN